MAVIRIDDGLYKKIIKFIKKEENKFEHPSVKCFVDKLIYKKVKEIEKIEEELKEKK